MSENVTIAATTMRAFAHGEAGELSQAERRLVHAASATLSVAKKKSRKDDIVNEAILIFLKEELIL